MHSRLSLALAFALSTSVRAGVTRRQPQDRQDHVWLAPENRMALTTTSAREATS